MNLFERLGFKKKSTNAPDHKTLVTIVVTMDPETGNISVQGNQLIDIKLSLMMLCEAGHSLINRPVKEMTKPTITH